MCSVVRVVREGSRWCIVVLCVRGDVWLQYVFSLVRNVGEVGRCFVCGVLYGWWCLVAQCVAGGAFVSVASGVGWQVFVGGGPWRW